MPKQPQFLVERHINYISRCYIGAVITMSILIGATYATTMVALDRHALQQNISFLTSSQFIHFQELANQHRALVKASADDPAKAAFMLTETLAEIRSSVAEIRRIGAALADLQTALQQNLLERFNPRDEAGSILRADLNERLNLYLQDADRVGPMDETGRKGARLASAAMGLAMASDSIMIWQFSDLIRIVYDRSSLSIQNVKWITAALLLLIIGVLLFASLFLFTPLLKKLRIEHTKTRQIEARLTALAHHDALTQLFNRSSFNQTLADMLAAWKQSRRGFAVVLIDLDHFKRINDTFGHPTGDATLMHVAECMRRALPEAGLGARLGGDEFAILIPGGTDLDHVRDIANEIRAAIAMPFAFENRLIHVTVSIGGAAVPDHADSAASLIRAADLALYSAKAQRDCVVFFDDQSMAARLQQNQLATAVNCAAERGEFEVHYQPMVDLPSGRHLGFEALVRWRHPELGLLAPGSFLHLLEGHAAMLGLTAAVVKTVGRDIRAWTQAGLRPGTISINMPEATLLSSSGFDIFAAVIDENQIDWGNFSLEITEDVLLNREPARIAEAVARFRDRGVAVSLDDFGTGFASLVHLRDFPVEEMKIDRSFVARIGVDRGSEQIIRSMLDLARNLGKKCVAEGIETTEHRRFLLNAGCEIGQGYLFAKPAPFETVTRYLEAAHPADQEASDRPGMAFLQPDLRMVSG